MPKILVIGERFIDRWYVGTSTRLSPEAPVPVTTVKEVIQSPGGAGNVAENLKALGAYVTEIYQQTPYPIKSRIISNGQQLARWDEHDYAEPFDPYKMRLWAPLFQDKDALVISDYGKGAFTRPAIAVLFELASKIPYIFLDTKRDPDDFFCAAKTFYFPNQKEYTMYQDSYEARSKVVLTRSEQGMSLMYRGEEEIHEPSLARDVVSVSGAGDTAIAAFAYDYCKHESAQHALRFASQACAVAVGKPYTSTVTNEEIIQAFG